MRTFLIALALLLPTSALAHGDSPSFESTTNGYLIDIGYDTIGFRPEEPVTFDFDLFTENADAFVPFSEVKVEIAKDGYTTHDQTIENDGTNVPTATITFAERGEYVLHASFMSGSTTLAYDTYPIPVEPLSGIAGRIAQTLTYVIAAISILVALYVIVQSLMSRRRL